jgi:hypothetical protein
MGGGPRNRADGDGSPSLIEGQEDQRADGLDSSFLFTHRLPVPLRRFPTKHRRMSEIVNVDVQ